MITIRMIFIRIKTFELYDVYWPHPRFLIRSIMVLYSQMKKIPTHDIKPPFTSQIVSMIPCRAGFVFWPTLWVSIRLIIFLYTSESRLLLPWLTKGYFHYKLSAVNIVYRDVFLRTILLYFGIGMLNGCDRHSFTFMYLSLRIRLNVTESGIGNKTTGRKLCYHRSSTVDMHKCTNDWRVSIPMMVVQINPNLSFLFSIVISRNQPIYIIKCARFT